MAFPNAVSTVANWSQDVSSLTNEGAVGPFADGVNRYMILFDSTTNKMRAYKSVDTGATWTEQDSSNAPAVANDTGSPSPGLYNFFGVVQDSRSGQQKLYVVYWHTDFTVSLIPFNTGTDAWGTRIGSTLGYLFGDQPNDTTGFAVAFTATPSAAVWMALATGNDVVTPVPNRTNAAKCNLTTWDAAYTPVGITDASDLHDCQPVGAVTDSSGNVHLFFLSRDSAQQVSNPPFSTIISHQVIHTDGSLSSLGTVVSYTSNVSRSALKSVSYPSISSADRLMFTYQNHDTTAWHVVRGAAGDSPTWSDEQPTTASFLSGGSLGPMRGTVSLAGVDYIFYSYANSDGINQTFSYITSTGIGVSWSAENVVGNFDVTGIPVISSAVQPAAYSAASALAITTAYSAAGASTGQGYFELGAVPPPPPITTDIPVGQLVFYGVRRIRNVLSDPAPSLYPYYEKPYSYPIAFTVSAAGTALGIRGTPVQHQIPIADYDFELRRVELGDEDSAGQIAITLYNQSWRAISNLPVIGTYFFHISFAASQGANSWPSPPLLYPINTVIRFDIVSLLPVADTPKNFELLFTGVRRIKCRS